LTFADYYGIVWLMATAPHTPEPPVEDALGVAEVAHILGVHPRTIERRRGLRKAPRPLEVQREEKLQRIWHELMRIFTLEDAIYWLRNPVPVLQNRRPVEVMAEDGGLDRVLDVVGRMGWGIPG
jgi:putative toxin-antitoxin system antitoxin component (TIGR02293 family)